MRRLRSGFTTRASCLFAAGVTALLCGLLLGVVDLVRAGAVGAATPVIAGIVVYRSRLRIAHQRSAEPLRAVAGQPVTIHLAITNRSVLRTGALLLEDDLPRQLTGNARFVVPGLAAREVRTVSYRMPDLARGRYRAGPLSIRLTDPFHMIDIQRSFTSTSDFQVAPVVDRLPSIEPPRSYDIGDNAGSHSIGAHGADAASTREYRTGDALRKIHWRSTARAGALMVRLEERPWQGRTTLLLDLRANAHFAMPPSSSDPAVDLRQRDSLEWAVSAGASIGTHLMLASRELGLVDDETGTERRMLDTPARLVDHLTDVKATSNPDLSRLSSALHTAGRDSALIAVLGLLDTTSLRILSQAHPRGSAVPAFALLLDTPGWAIPPEVNTAREDACAAPARVLRAAGWRVVIVRRGDWMPDAWLALLRARSDAVITAGSAQ